MESSFLTESIFYVYILNVYAEVEGDQVGKGYLVDKVRLDQAEEASGYFGTNLYHDFEKRAGSATKRMQNGRDKSGSSCLSLCVINCSVRPNTTRSSVTVVLPTMLRCLSTLWSRAGPPISSRCWWSGPPRSPRVPDLPPPPCMCFQGCVRKTWRYATWSRKRCRTWPPRCWRSVQPRPS